MKQDIRLIAMDLDGTALNSKKELTGRTRDAIEQAVKQGIHVVVATGKNIFFSGTCCFGTEGTVLCHYLQWCCD